LDAMAPDEMIADFPILTSTSEVIFSTKSQISRWSNLGVSPNGCAAIVVPSTEQDITSVIRYTARTDLKILTTAGKHGTVLPIDERSIYLDLAKFDTVELEEGAGCVKIGGGVVAGRMCSALAKKGWYTSMY
jgi:FAD/FMN-containing dehydrogenase